MQIHGKVIYDFPFGDSVIEQHFCDFFLRDDSHEFIIEIADYPLEVVFDLLESKVVSVKERNQC